MLLSRRQVRWWWWWGGGLYLYGDEDDQDVIFAQLDATTGMGTETFAIAFVPDGQSCTSAVFDNLI